LEWLGNREVQCERETVKKLAGNIAEIGQIDARSDVSNATSRLKNIPKELIVPFKFKNDSAIHDTDAIHVNDASKTYMININKTLENKLVALDEKVVKCQREIEGAVKLEEQYSKDRELGDPHTCIEHAMGSRRALVHLLSSKSALEVQLQYLKTLVGKELTETKVHSWKPSSFAIASTCQACSGTLWGLSKTTGFVCEACHYACHAKCQMKASSCPSSTTQKIEVVRKSSSEVSIDLKTPSAPGFSFNDESLQSPHVADSSFSVRMVAMFQYHTASAEEIPLVQGESVLVDEKSLLDGWIKAKNTGGQKGYVPYNYLERESTGTSMGSPLGPESSTVPSGASAGTPSSKRYAVVLYDYAAQTPEELTIRENDTLELVDDSPEDWWEGILDGKKGLVPANYVRRL